MDRVKERETVSRLVLLVNKCKGLIGAIEEYSRLGYHASAIQVTETLTETGLEIREQLVELKASRVE